MDCEYYEGKFSFYELGDIDAEMVWSDVAGNRRECWMDDAKRPYTYGEGKYARTYESIEMPVHVGSIRDALNESYGTDYNVCMANYYRDKKDALGWHADDSEGMDHGHAIAVVSFGSEREIWTKEKGIDDVTRFTLGDGSLFVMPIGYQLGHFHRIPRHSAVCGPRLSLTFRRML